MAKSCFFIWFLFFSYFCTGDAVATVFAGGDSPPQIQVKGADFLKSIGVVATTTRLNHAEESDLKVSFTSSEAENYEDIFVELLLLDTEGTILVSVETPFVNGDHTVSYIVPRGYSLVVSIAMPVSEATEYYKVSFINK